MNKFFILVLLFNIFSCEKEVMKRKTTPSPSHSTPIVQPERKAKSVDNISPNAQNSKTTIDIPKSSNYTLSWQIEKNRKTVLKNFENSYEDGLNPADYNTAQLLKYEKKLASLNERQLEKYETLLTTSFQKYISHLTNGRLNPIKLYRNWDLKVNKIDTNKTLSKLLKSDSLAEKIELLKPQNLVYKRLKKALAIINDLPNNKLNPIKIKNIIVQNDTNSSLIDIKKRLIYWKDLPRKDSLSAIYDSETVEAIKKFQTRHGLAADGIIGKITVGSLNFSKKQRREQIIANLERWKWFPRQMGKEYQSSTFPIIDYPWSKTKIRLECTK